jgi:hypothetical protein
MDAGKNHGNSTVSDFDILSGTVRFSTPIFLEGMELLEAFSKIKRETVRQEIIALARRLSTRGA